MRSGNRKLEIAEESVKTRKAREKLKRQFADLEQRITPQELKKKSIEIHRWIARHASQRIILKNKNICLFDENQHAARISQKVTALANLLKHEVRQISQENSLDELSVE